MAGFGADDGEHLPVSILFNILRVPDLSGLWAQEHIGLIEPTLPELPVAGVHTVAELLELDPDDRALREIGVEAMVLPHTTS